MRLTYVIETQALGEAQALHVERHVVGWAVRQRVDAVVAVTVEEEVGAVQLPVRPIDDVQPPEPEHDTAMRSQHPELAGPAKRCLGARAGCFLALDPGLGLVGTASARR